MHEPPKLNEKASSLKTLTLVIYILYVSSIVIGFTWFIAFIINLIKNKSTAGTVYASHFRWQIRTVLFYFLWLFIGSLITFVSLSALFKIGMLLGITALGGASVWYIYRIIKGLIYLNRDQAMY